MHPFPLEITNPLFVLNSVAVFRYIQLSALPALRALIRSFEAAFEF